jgi:ribosomal protein S18 acetylase RimI-like enzyme
MRLEIRKIKGEYDECEECAGVIRNSFITVAGEFNLTRENAPTNPAFSGTDSLIKMKEKGIEMYGAYKDGRCIGFVAVEKADEAVFYMERLAVLPEYRHNGYGKELMDFVFDFVRNSGGRKVSIGIINENKRLKDWYIGYGFVETGKRAFKHLPFEVCFMEKTA